MVDELRHAVEQVERQPEDVQRQIAEIIEDALREHAWDALVSTPESQRFLADLAAETRAAIARGDTEEGGWDL